MFATSKRVEQNTAPNINKAISAQTERNVAWYESHPEKISERLNELEREWDIERVVEAQSSSLMLAGVILGASVSRKFLIIPTVVGGFLLQHAIQGWCPPIPVLRRLGVRTPAEIQAEICALKELAVKENRSQAEALQPTAESAQSFANMI